MVNQFAALILKKEWEVEKYLASDKPQNIKLK